MKIWKYFGRRSKLSPKEKKAGTIEQIAIFGYADAPVKSTLFQQVKDVTKILAEAGYTVVDGGGSGVMRAATLGAKDGGGKVIGVTLEVEDIPHFEGRDPRNLFDKEIKTKNYIERTLTLLKEGQVYVIFNGGTGTISEFGMAWGLARLYFGHHKPLILYGKFWKKIIKSFKDNMLLRPEELKVYKIADDPEDVLDAIKDFEDEIERGGHNHSLKASSGGFTI
ncbi:LOG family protein [Candidatus Daviesbacteria bacterium]|nr:LOG family protein [Candidatus Daviesbacteria bacterium]